MEAPSGLLTGPATWRGSGVEISIPAGWTGQEGDGARVLLLAHPSGTRLEVWSWPRTAAPAPRPREGCEPLFLDRGRYRSVPGLAVEAISSCVTDAPQGIVIEGWYAAVGDREIHLEAVYPAGRVIEGGEIVGPILEGIRAVE